VCEFINLVLYPWSKATQSNQVIHIQCRLSRYYSSMNSTVCDVNNLVFNCYSKAIELNQIISNQLCVLSKRSYSSVNTCWKLIIWFYTADQKEFFLKTQNQIKSSVATSGRLLRNVFIHEHSCMKLIIWFMLLVKSNRMESKSSATVQRLPTRLGCKKSDFPTGYGCKNMTSRHDLGWKSDLSCLKEGYSGC
jgi:hypothetical protein